MNSVPSTAQHSTAQHSTAQHSTAQPYLASDSFSFLRYCEPKAWRCWKAKRSPSRYFRVQSEEHRAHVIVLAGESCRFNKLFKSSLDCDLTNYFRTKGIWSWAEHIPNLFFSYLYSLKSLIITYISKAHKGLSTRNNLFSNLVGELC